VIAAFVIVAVAAIVAATVLVLRWRDPEKAPHRITPPAGRILFPFLGDTISRPELDATLRLARAENATLVPVYLVTVPLHLALEAPLPRECERALPLLDVIEQRAARLHVPVESRIETGRSARHALRRALEAERFDRLVVPAATRTSSGFSAEDVAWLLEEVPGEIVVLRADEDKPAPTAGYLQAAV